MKKTLIIIMVLAVAGGAVYFYQRSAKQVQAPSEENAIVQDNPDQAGNKDSVATATQTTQQTAPPAANTVPKPASKPATTKQSTGTFSSGEEGMAPDIQVWEVVYDGNGFSPKALSIKLGDIVIIQNNSSGSVWPASDPHPTHTAYPEFDPKKPVAAGSKFQFQFTKAGTWGYHNHLNASQIGTITVSK